MTHELFAGFFDHLLADARCERRAEKVLVDLLDSGNATINKFSETHTEKIGAYRMLANESFNHKDLAEAIYRHCKKNVRPGHFLGINDTTELNFTNHKGRIGNMDQDIGPITNKNNIGFFCHPMLIIDPENQIPAGISSINIWSRQESRPNRHERDYKKQDIKEKESFRWITSARGTKKLLQTCTLTIIADRESDIYEEFVLIPDERTDLLIRSSYDRKLYGEKQSLYEKLSSSPLQATYKINIPAGTKRTKRIARMSLRYEKVKISRPVNRPKGELPDYVELWAIEAMELPESVPAGEEPVHWRLLTTHDINAITDALTYVEWYSLRWLVEELFHLIKSKGFGLESAQLEKGAGLKKLCVLAIQASLTVMTLKLSLQNNHKIKADLLFSEEELMFLEIYMKELEGKTAKQKNPHKKNTLQWAAWALARLGGWSGYESQGPPGYITIKNGLDRFNDKVESFVAVMNYFKKKDLH
jgi:hypothetical protein